MKEKINDYLDGRLMKVDLTSDAEFDAWEYDRDTGEGAAADAIKSLRETGDVNPLTTQVVHFAGVLAAGEKTKRRLGEKPSWGKAEIPGLGTVTTLRLGLNDVADVLRPKINETEKRLRGTKVADSE